MDALPCSPEDLLAHTRWLRALARRLLQDPNDADDVAQDALVAALEHPPAPDRPLEPWLARVAANFARRRRRGEGRRRAREAAAASLEALPSPAELVERVSVQQDVVRAVLALDEPYRSTLLLRFFCDLSPADIAARQGIEPATVRQRLARGRAALRERLRERYGDERALGAALLALAELPGRAPAGPVPGRPPHAPALLPALLMSGVVALAAGAGLWIAWLARPAARSNHAQGSPIAARSSAATTDTATPEESDSPPARLAVPSAERSAAAATGSLRVHVRRESDGSRVVSEVVLVQQMESLLPWPDVRRARTDEAGEARLDDLEPGEVRVSLLRRGDDGDQWLTIEAGRETAVESTLPTGIDVAGRVVDASGRALAGAEIWLSERWQSVHGHVLERTDERGEFLVRDVQLDGLNWLGARSRGWAPSPVRSFEGHDPGEKVEIEIVLDRPGALVRGVVRDASGAAVPGASVLLGYESSEWARGPGAPPLLVATGELGDFELDGVPLGVLPIQVRAAGFGSHSASVEIRAPASEPLEVTIRPEATLVGRVLDGAGEPVPGASIVSGTRGAFASSRARSGPDGRFRLTGLPGGAVALAADEDRAGHAETTLELAPGEESAWDPVLGPAPRVFGTVLDARGTPVAGAELALFVGSGESWAERYRVRWLETDTEGRFAVDAADAPHTLLVFAGPSSMPAPILRDVRPRSAALELCLPEAESLAAIAASVVGPDGGRVEGAGLGVRIPGEGHRELFLQPLSAEGVELAVPAGPLELWAEASGLPRLDLPVLDLGPGERAELGTIRLPVPAFVRGSLGDERARAGDSLRLEWFDAQGRLLGRSSPRGAEFESPPLGPGTCTLIAQGDFLERREERLVIEPGRDQVRDLRFEPAGLRPVRFELPTGAPRPSGLSAVARDEEGLVRWSWAGALVPGGPIEVRVSGPAGRHALTARTDTGLVARGTVEIAGPGIAQPPLVLELVLP